jgi:hypothetical protein
VDFRTFLEGIVDPKQVVSAALKARSDDKICRARFGDCRSTATATVKYLNEMGIPAKLAGGQFITNPAEDEEWDHSWVQVGQYILDPTVDQFFSSLDVDMETKTPGVYYSHPLWDGSGLAKRYK